MSSVDTLPFTAAELAFLQRVVAREVSYLQDNRRREEWQDGWHMEPSQEEQLAQTVATKIDDFMEPAPAYDTPESVERKMAGVGRIIRAFQQATQGDSGS